MNYTLSSQTAGLGAALTGLDVSHAQHAGSVAVENNLGPLVVALAAMKGKDIYDTTDGAIAAYQEDGAEGLVDFGVDEGIGMLVAGTAMKGAKVVGKGAKKALDAVEDMLPDAVTKAVGKAANSAGGVLKEATAVLDSAKGKAKTTVKSVFGLRGGKPSSSHLPVPKEGVTIELEFKDGMDVRDFNRKVKALQDLAERGKLSKAPNPVQRDGSVTKAYRTKLQERAQKQWKESEPERYKNVKQLIEDKHVDHMHELQVMGQDHFSNMSMLHPRVNTSVGSQIYGQIKKLPDGTPITKVTIKEKSK